MLDASLPSAALLMPAQEWTHKANIDMLGCAQHAASSSSPAAA